MEYAHFYHFNISRMSYNELISVSHRTECDTNLTSKCLKIMIEKLQ